MLWFGCQEPAPELGPVTDYVVTHHTQPDPLVAGEGGTFTLTIADQDGRAVEDLQTNHERIVHTMLIAKDLSSFSHEHDRVKLCGSEAMNGDCKKLLEERGFTEGNGGEPGSYVLEKAFVTK